MPVAYPFSTLGKLNGLPGCVPKVDVSGFDYWTTASGYNKDDFDASTAVTQEQIDQSLHKIGRLFWNLYRLEIGTRDSKYDPQPVTEVIVKGEQEEAIQPKDRVCSGSLSEEGPQYFRARANLLLDPLESGFARMYKGDRDDEENFIGYGLGEANWLPGSPLETYLTEELVAEAYVGLGGYKRYEVDTTRTHHYSYVTINNIDMVFYGFVGKVNVGETPQFIDNPPTSTYEEFDFKAEITSLEMWEY